MSITLVGVLYTLSAIAFILGLKKLASPKSAPRGNLIGAIGMGIAVFATLFTWTTEHGTALPAHNMVWILIAIGLGGAVGWLLAKRVEMTSMPQLVAGFNGFGGIASALVALGEVINYTSRFTGDVPSGGMTAAIATLSVAIGALTFTGSFVAFGKLQGVISSAPKTFGSQKIVNIGLAAAIVICTALYYANAGQTVWVWLALLAGLVLGVSGTISIGGADMPVVVALLNSFSGIAASAAGFVTHNELLVVAGALVGASGLILTMVMCNGMNRSLANVLFAAFGTGDDGGASGGTETRTVRNYGPIDGAILLSNAQSVIVVPGYGLAVAQAQHAVQELASMLEERNVDVKYAIHPVAGRMPGHMNVLLAESNVPYEQLLDLEQVNPLFESADVALVVGANDVVNPSARTDEASPIYGMPILDADKAQNVIILKRSLGTGFAGTANDLFFEDKTMMLFGDAKKTLLSLIAEVKEL